MDQAIVWSCPTLALCRELQRIACASRKHRTSRLVGHLTLPWLGRENSAASTIELRRCVYFFKDTK